MGYLAFRIINDANNAHGGRIPKCAGIELTKNRIFDWFQKSQKPSGLVAVINRHAA
jgi:hypothetical protein